MTTDGPMIPANPIRGDSLEINEADDGLVVFDPAQDIVHHLNPSASMIFDLCDGSRDVQAIAEILAEAFELQAPPTEDALAGLRDLAEQGLIRWPAQGEAQG